MIWFVISIILLLFSAAVTGVALSNNVKGAGIGLIPGLVGLLLLIPACLYSVDVGEVAVIRNMGGSLAGHSERGLPLEDAVAERHQIRHP